MKRNKITRMIDFITTKDAVNGVAGEFIMIDKKQYIDIDNLGIYTVAELQIILGKTIKGAKKEHYIKFILKNNDFVAKQKSINRDIKLSELGL